MKRLFVVLLVAGLPGRASAVCGPVTEHVLAAETPMPVDGELVLETSPRIMEHFYGMGAGTARLEAADHEVSLRARAAHAGERGVAQLRFRPKAPLRPGTVYRIRYAPPLSLLPVTLMARLMGSTDRAPTVRTATVPAAPEPPRWVAAPVVERSVYQPMGCGPAAYVRIRIPAQGTPPLLVETLLSHPSGAHTTYELPVEDGHIDVGHGMCHGAFRLRPGVGYRAQLTLIDGRGRRAAMPGPPLTVLGPGPARR